MSRFFLTVPLDGDSFEEAETSRDKLVTAATASPTALGLLYQQIEERPPLYKYEIPWQAMAILCGMPYATENELQDHFGNGRTCWSVNFNKDEAHKHKCVGLGISKETYPISCYVNLDWQG